MTEKFCVYCQEVTPHYVNQYGCFECCNCEPLSETDYESDSSHETYVPDGSDSDQTIIILDTIRYSERQWGHWLARNIANTKQKLGLGLNQKSRRVSVGNNNQRMNYIN